MFATQPRLSIHLSSLLNWVVHMDAPTISNLIAGVSTLLAAFALLVARKAQKANHKLAADIANAPGRLHEVLMEHARGPDGEPTIELICVNGPSVVTVREISLSITYYEVDHSGFQDGPVNFG